MTSDGWDWLREMPTPWQTPDVMRTPTASPPFNLGLLIIGSNIVGNLLVEAVAEFMAAYARLEIWMGEVQPPFTFQEQFGTGRVADEALKIVHGAWVAFEAAHRAGGGKALPAEDVEALLRSVRDGTAILVAARSRPTG